VAEYGGVEVGDVIGVLGGACMLLAQHIDHLSGFENVELVEVGAHVVLHVFYHAANVRNVCLDIGQAGGQTCLQKAQKTENKNEVRVDAQAGSI
jgi:hypothetical protein